MPGIEKYTEITIQVSKHLNIHISKICGKTSDRSAIKARQIAHYLTFKLQGLSLKEIGRKIGSLDRNTVRYSIETIENEISIYPEFKRKIEEIERSLVIVEEEIWRDIPGYIGFYQASNMGKIRSLDRIINGKMVRGILLNCKIAVTLRVNGAHKCSNISRIVAKTFIANPDNLPLVLCLDGNKGNCKVSNLIWSK